MSIGFAIVSVLDWSIGVVLFVVLVVVILFFAFLDSEAKLWKKGIA
jgi:ABC-type transport system involved in cytochrome bd biosynthesis fused ATPase/permease subunit